MVDCSHSEADSLPRYLATNGIMGNNSNYMEADPVDGYNYGSFGFALASPLSRGNISISSSDMADPPLINPNMLSNSADAEVMLAAFKRTRDMWAAVSNVTIGKCFHMLQTKEGQTD